MANRIGIVDAPYEVQRAYACEASKKGRYAAVVEIIRYGSGSITTTVASGNVPIRTHSRGGEFRGVVAQFHDGKPYIPMTDEEHANRIFRAIERKWDRAMA